MSLSSEISISIFDFDDWRSYITLATNVISPIVEMTKKLDLMKLATGWLRS